MINNSSWSSNYNIWFIFQLSDFISDRITTIKQQSRYFIIWRKWVYLITNLNSKLTSRTQNYSFCGFCFTINKLKQWNTKRSCFSSSSLSLSNNIFIPCQKNRNNSFLNWRRILITFFLNCFQNIFSNS